MPMTHRRGFLVAATLALVFCSATAVMAQEAREALFAATEQALADARASQVDLLAPRSFGEAQATYESALEDFERGRNLARIRDKLAKAAESMESARKSAEVSRVTLAAPLSTRADAVAAEAEHHAPQAWRQAAERFTEAAIAVERGDLKAAQRRAAEAEVLFREAELDAIKGSVLDEARRLIAQAEEARVEREAPVTLDNARRLLAQAEQEIVRNRYDTELPRSLAQQAEYEARHALYLSGLIKRVADEKYGIEALILDWEQPLRQMAGEVDLVPRFDQGYAPTMEQLLEHVREQQRRIRQLERDIADRDAQIAALSSEMDRLQARLGGVSEERIALQRRVDAQARLRANLATIEGMFAADEARVLREGDDVVLRLIGLNFPSGKATIEPSSFPLLGKVQDAIRLFEGVSIVIEGHTDSYGSDSANFILSQDRADAVRQYLISNMGLDAEAVSSIGYGETRPVATNDTAEGRARNRRIDLVIRLDASQFD